MMFKRLYAEYQNLSPFVFSYFASLYLGLLVLWIEVLKHV